MKSALSLTKLYPRLHPDERARLTLAAMGREDSLEVQRLTSSCPRYRYEQPDEKYLEQMEASRLVAANFAILWQEARHDLTVAELILEKYIQQREPHTKYKTTLELALAVANSPAAEMIAARAVVVKATYDGLVRFAQTVEIDLDNLLVWYKPIADDVRNTIARLPAKLATRKSHSDLVFNTLSSVWPGPMPVSAC